MIEPEVKVPVRPWYKMWWGISFLVFGALVIISVIVNQGAAQKGYQDARQETQPTATQAKHKNPSPKPAPKITYKMVNVTESVPFSEEHTQDPNLEKGQSQVRQEGASGVKTFTYKVQLKDNVEMTRALESEVVSVQPTSKIIADGTKGSDETVFITKTGERYHRAHPDGCHSYLSRSKFAVSKSQAIAQGFTPCQCGQCGW